MRYLDEALLASLIERIGAEDAITRDLGADEVTDVVGSVNAAEARAICVALVNARLVERNVTAQEAQLNALCELSDLQPLPVGVVDLLRAIDTPTLDRGQVGHLRYLLDSQHLRRP